MKHLWIAAALLGAYAAWTALGIYGSRVLHVSHADEPVGFWLGRWGPNLALLAGYGWSTFESLRYHGVLRACFDNLGKEVGA